ncbi:uncharacterized protein LOC116026977 [Ipomoea triloba]|uniref:uncharacterized protein LOC116026977 n=1 Tax=Ipomoea triloba TaxID=35885 RepID=UPI00125DAB00|nr:uncharacterized protein LOC116026977 [Ipomoea triloba]
MGGRVDRTVNQGGGPPVYRLNGQNFHLIGSLQPVDGATPKFAQLYIHDTENEVNNRLTSIRNDIVSSSIEMEVVNDIKAALDEHNVLVKSFRMARSEIQKNPRTKIRMRLIEKRSKDARTYNLPTVSEVAALIVGDLDPDMGMRDIIVECKSGLLKRINELNPAYLPLQYPLLFPFGEDGYRDDIQFCTNTNEVGGSRERISPREYFPFKIHERRSQLSTLLHARRLLQQFLVDGYTMVEAGRLLFIRNNQKALRCEVYKGLSDALYRGDIAPSTQGYPSLFITFTCNPKWPEIQRYVQLRGLRAEDRPDIVARIFKMKLDSLIKEFKAGQLFGPKWGLPHAHILLFLGLNTSIPCQTTVDSIISAEIPSKELDPEYHQAVEELMLHGPCGVARKTSPCMVNGWCSKHFPKKFVKNSNFDADGYPIYRRRDDGKTITKNGIHLDNRYMGNDRVTAEFYKTTSNADGVQLVDEINMYYNCRYVSASEATWRLLSFEIQCRNPLVERLSFHLPDSQTVFFQDDEDVETVLNKETLGQSMSKKLNC